MEFSRRRILEWVALPSPGDLPDPGTEPRSPALQIGSLPSEPPGKPKNTGVGSLSLLQGSSLPRNQTVVSCIAGGFFTSRATRAFPGSFFQFSSVQSSRSVVSNSLLPHEPQHARPPCPSQTPRVHPNTCLSS